jgi:hypothetical protein
MLDENGDVVEPPDDDATSVTRAERASADPDDFWQARPILKHIHAFARSQRVGPWAVLGTALARVIAQTPPEIQLPPTIGSYASLNLFVGLVGESGDGKDAAQEVAADALYIENPTFRVAPLGSGEGLAHMFMRPGKATKDDPYPEAEQYNRSSLVTIGEIDSLAALVQRQSSTVTTQLRQAAMGQQLGFFYADAAKRMMVPPHSYRLCLVAGIQPERSGILLNDEAGGTPQRFIWLPTGDPGAQRSVPPAPTPMIWQPPDWMYAERAHSNGQMRRLVTLPEIVRDMIIDARVSRLQGTGEKLNSHALLTRAKVAAAFMILDGRYRPEETDWDLSGTVMTVSDTQRARCQRALQTEAKKANLGKALADADRTLVVEEHIDRVKVTKCSESVKRILRINGAVTSGVLRQKLHVSNREYMDAAVDVLHLAGEIQVEETEYRGQKGKRIWLPE